MLGLLLLLFLFSLDKQNRVAVDPGEVFSLNAVISLLVVPFAVTMAGVVTAICVAFFSLGEMTCSPKFSEYIGVNAPADKKALYMGLSNIPFAVGWIVGNVVSGPLYDAFANKIQMTKRYLLEVEKIPLETLEKFVDNYKAMNPDGLLPETIAKMNIDTFDFFPYFQEITNNAALDKYAVNQLLWNTYHPWKIWIVLSSFGILSIAAMLLYNRHKSKINSK